MADSQNLVIWDVKGIGVSILAGKSQSEGMILRTL